MSDAADVAVKARLFVALELPDGVAAALAAWTPRDPGLRPLAQRALHVTLCFIGWRPEPEIAALVALLPACAAPVPELALAGPVWLPPRAPRVLAIDIADPDGRLARLQAYVSAALAEGAGYEPEQRPFRAHVTVARVRRGSRPAPSLPPLPGLAPFPGAALTLFRSRLARAGADYEPLVRIALAAEPRSSRS